MLDHSKMLKSHATALMKQDEIQALLLQARQTHIKEISLDLESIQQSLSSGTVDIKVVYPLLKAMQRKNAQTYNFKLQQSQHQGGGRKR